MKRCISRLAMLLCWLVLPGSVLAQNLLTNGNFEAGLAGWSTWSAPDTSFWNGSWIHSNDCDIWPPAICPYGGSGQSHAQKKGSGAGNAHGGLYQTVSVVPGTRYRLRGQWAGGATGNAPGNATWWEVVVFSGAVTDSVIDAGTRAQDTQVAKIEIAELALNGVHQFQWQPFSRDFVATSPQVTVVLKTGSFYTLDAAAYHDDLVLEPLPITPVPLDAPWMLVLTALALAAGATWVRRTTGT